MTAKRAYALPAHEIREMLLEGSLDPADYVSAIYERIKMLEEKLNAFITLKPREVVEAEVREILRKAREDPSKYPLAGVLVAVKDNIHVKGLPVTCASRMLQKYVAPYDATVITRLKMAGAVIIGKTNMDEFAMGSTGENSAFGPTRNPWDTERVPGGSSSGTAAALAAGMATIGLGSDTGGSIRIPAAWTGLYGLKPTYGLVSRYGLVAYADSLEQIGPMARNTLDLAITLKTIAGFDPHDATSLRTQPGDYCAAAREGYTHGAMGVNIVTLEDFLEHEGVDESIKNLIVEAETKLREVGARVSRARLGKDIVDYSLPAYYIIAMAEASSNLARYDGVRYGPKVPPEPWESWNKYYSRIRGEFFGREVKLRIMLGSWFLSAGYRDQYYIRALKLRRLVRDRLLKLLSRNTLLLAPAVVSPPPRIGEVVGDPQKMYALDLATVPVNLAGLPALAAPVGYIEGIPTGIQLIAAPQHEPLLFKVSAALESVTGMRNLTTPTWL